MKVTLRLGVFAAVILAAACIPSQATLSSTDSGVFGTEQVVTQPQTRIDQGMGEQADVFDLLRRESDPDGISGATPAFTVEDGTYRLSAGRQAESTVQFSQANTARSEGYRPERGGDHIEFSYPSSSQGGAQGDRDRLLEGVDSGAAGALGVASEFERPGAGRPVGSAAWSDGISKLSLTRDYIPANDTTLIGAHPNVIMPEPNVFVLCAVFGGALLIFSRRNPSA